MNDFTPTYIDKSHLHLKIVHEISDIVNRSSGLETILKSVVKKISDYLNYDVVTISLGRHMATYFNNLFPFIKDVHKVSPYFGAFSILIQEAIDKNPKRVKPVRQDGIDWVRGNFAELELG